jgi:tryptophan-rich sensory protein
MRIKGIVKTFITFAGSLAVCLLAGYMGWYPQLPGMPAWYAGLVKPLFSPPAWVYPQAWMVSFLLMGIVLFLILHHGVGTSEATMGLILFVLQLILTIAWAFTFFGIHSVFFAFMFIIALWATLLSTVIQVFRFSVYGGMLLVPCFLWVCYLAWINYGIMVLNNLTFKI